jgi:hypothetical protein
MPKEVWRLLLNTPNQNSTFHKPLLNQPQTAKTFRTRYLFPLTSSGKLNLQYIARQTSCTSLLFKILLLTILETLTKIHHKLYKEPCFLLSHAQISIS